MARVGHTGTSPESALNDPVTSTIRLASPYWNTHTLPFAPIGTIADAATICPATKFRLLTIGRGPSHG